MILLFINMSHTVSLYDFKLFFFFFFFFLLYRAASPGLGVELELHAAAGLYHSHSNMESKLHL